VIKCGAVRDLALFEWLEANMERLVAREPDAVVHAVIESCRIKAEIVAADELESGERALLNFGHTFAHAIETATGYRTWLHGEAVAAGMVLAAAISGRVAGLSAAEAERIHELIKRAGLPAEPPPIAADRWFELMARDKKTDAGELRLVLLERLGRGQLRAGLARSQVIRIFG
jgi:3-dehydroquinate synthase